MSNFAIVHLRLQLLIILQFPTSPQEILLNTVIPIIPNSKHASLSADIPKISAIELIGHLSKCLEIDIALGGDPLGMDFEDFVA
jgi:hypothetical protein